MKIAGIVAEYNPFHKGHELHISETRRELGEDSAIVCCMSGDFVQRGEPAIFSKHIRAESAVKGGADLVVELPLAWAMASAETFARGAVGLLGELGCIEYLSFGSESGEVEPLKELAAALSDPDLPEKIKKEMKSGMSFAAARQLALVGQIGELATILDTPNNILAVEYIKQINELGLEIKPMTFLRFGSGHDEEGDDEEFKSSSEIRERMCSQKEYRDFVPESSFELLQRESDCGRGPVTIKSLEPMLLSRMRMLDDEIFKHLPDATEGLHNRLKAKVQEAESWGSILSGTKSKRYALSRIRRMAMSACLGISAAMSIGVPKYARVLAANNRGREILRLLSETSHVPVITKPADIRRYEKDLIDSFKVGAKARDLYVLAYESKIDRRGGSDWRMGPTIL